MRIQNAYLSNRTIDVCRKHYAAGRKRSLLIASQESAATMASFDPQLMAGLGSLADLRAPTMAIPASEPIAHQETPLDMADVRGVGDEVIDALVDAARSRRPVMFVAPPGCGKTMLAARLPGLLPELTQAEAATVMRIASVTTAPLEHPARPFRAPHHSVSLTGLTCNVFGDPGEAVLAHLGVLFLDEFGQFSDEARHEVLRMTETKKVTTANGRVSMPADFWLVGAVNPCPCGYFSHPTRPCLCSPESIRRPLHRWRSTFPPEGLVIELPFPAPHGPLSPSTAELRRRIASR